MQSVALRIAIILSLFVGFQQCLQAQTTIEPIETGPFLATDDSLSQNYQVPDWFRDAKLGIWAHWGPQSVPMSGDWYARNMYIQGSSQYQHHLETYGPPSQKGYKDIIPLWTAEKWDPDRLMALYKKAGARYFVSMGCHHDNFDLWNSKYNHWNAVNMGPKRDVVGTWQKAAKHLGLKFGVSEHLAASFTWFQPSHGADKTGPFAGIPYDGADPKYQDLYHRPTAPGDNAWMTTDARSQAEWYQRIRDLVDNYQPDLLYSDSGLPFGNDIGRSLIAHYYNSSASHHEGKTDVVYTCKESSRGRWVEDLERGVMPGIRPNPWQTDTSIGDWFYNRNWKYRGADWVIHMLVDIVSKNGNLLINVVQRPDGSLDPEAEQILKKVTVWNAINGEGIFGTRPWIIHGEGSVRAKGGAFAEDFAYSARDIRFTTRGQNTLYAFALGWPEDGKIVVRSLAKLSGVTGVIQNVSLLGSHEKVTWHHTEEGLIVTLPAHQPCDYAVALKIRGKNLRGFKPDLALPSAPVVRPDAQGNIHLKAEDAELSGGLHTEQRDGIENLGFWDDPADYASWKVNFPQPGIYRITAVYATVNSASAFVIANGDVRLEAAVKATGSWDYFVEFDAGSLSVAKAGESLVTLRPRDPASWAAINLRELRLIQQNP